MAGWIAVLADNDRLVRIAPLREGESGVVNLTTMLPSQERAYVEVYFVRDRTREPVHTFYADKLGQGDPQPQIVVSAHVRGEVTMTLRVDGELIAAHSTPIPPAMRVHRRSTLLLALLLLIAAALAFGAWWLATGDGWLTTRDGRPSSEARSPAARSPEVRPPAPTPPAARELPAVAASRDVADALDARATVHFLPESAELLPEAVEEIATIADRIAGWIDGGGSAESLRIEVEGHTAHYGNEASRVELSIARAQAVADRLRAELDAEGVDMRIQTAGYGAERPVTQSRTDEWRNRRVRITVIGDVSGAGARR